MSKIDKGCELIYKFFNQFLYNLTNNEMNQFQNKIWKKKYNKMLSIYLLFLLLWWLRRTDFDDILFGLDAILFDCRLLLCWMAFSLVPCALLLTITRDAPSKRSLRLSPTIRKLGKRIQQVLTVHDPDMPWHLHSCRISVWTCYLCAGEEKKSWNYTF